jgi:hypothetical protein
MFNFLKLKINKNKIILCKIPTPLPYNYRDSLNVQLFEGKKKKPKQKQRKFCRDGSCSLFVKESFAWTDHSPFSFGIKDDWYLLEEVVTPQGNGFRILHSNFVVMP